MRRHLLPGLLDVVRIVKADRHYFARARDRREYVDVLKARVRRTLSDFLDLCPQVRPLPDHFDCVVRERRKTPCKIDHAVALDGAELDAAFVLVPENFH